MEGLANPLEMLPLSVLAFGTVQVWRRRRAPGRSIEGCFKAIEKARSVDLRLALQGQLLSDASRSRRIRSTRCAGLKGLVRYSSAPPDQLFSRARSSVFVVSITTFVPGASCRVRI